LKFEFKEYDVEQRQECVQINYPNEHEYTRSVEFKHVTGQVHPRTAVSFETPQEHGEPYYPVPSNDNARLYTEYEQLALEERARANVFFVGRLARYKYLNMDEAIESALATFAEVKEL
jgi:UDP-galactopyranose mutase